MWPPRHVELDKEEVKTKKKKRFSWGNRFHTQKLEFQHHCTKKLFLDPSLKQAKSEGDCCSKFTSMSHSQYKQEKITKANILVTIARVIAIIMVMVITILGISPLQKSLSCPVSFKCHNFVWLEFIYPFYWWGKKKFWRLGALCRMTQLVHPILGKRHLSLGFLTPDPSVPSQLLSFAQKVPLGYPYFSTCL